MVRTLTTGWEIPVSTPGLSAGIDHWGRTAVADGEGIVHGQRVEVPVSDREGPQGLLGTDGVTEVNLPARAMADRVAGDQFFHRLPLSRPAAVIVTDGQGRRLIG